MPTDSSFFPTSETLKSRLDKALRIGRVPGMAQAERYGHWALRIPLMAVLMQYGLDKFPAVFTAPGGQGVPAVLFILAAFGEVLGAIALFIGGVVETWRPKDAALRLGGDVMTRAGGFAASAAVLGVIAFFYWPAVMLGDLHVILLGLSLFLLLRGNR